MKFVLKVAGEEFIFYPDGHLVATVPKIENRRVVVLLPFSVLEGRG